MILYFSGTGNSRYVAKNLGSLLQDEVVSIGTYLKSNEKGSFQSEKPYVFVTPSYMSRMPMKVEKFLMDAKFEGKKEAYYIVMYDVLDRDKAEAEAQKAMPVIENIAGLIQKGEELKNEGLNGHKMFSAIAPAFTATMVKAKSFCAEDSCIHCGKCASLCPLGNISYKDNKPVWGTECMHCMACISACPVKAIQYGKATKGRNRYYLEEK